MFTGSPTWTGRSAGGHANPSASNTVSSGQLDLMWLTSISALLTSKNLSVGFPDVSIDKERTTSSGEMDQWHLVTEIFYGGAFTEVVAIEDKPVKTSFLPWDRSPYNDIISSMLDLEIYNISLAPSVSASWNSFLSYGRGPRCTADYLAFNATASSTPWLSGKVASFTASNGSVSETISYKTVLSNYRGSYCCGSCWLIYFSVDVYYWPSQTGSCLNTTSNETGTVESHVTQPPVLGLGPNGITLSAPN